MIRHECLELLAAKMSDQLVVTSQSGQRIEWSHLSKHEGNLLVGMMGCAIGVATGLALALPHRKGDRARFRRQRAAVALQSRDFGKSSAEEFGHLRLRQRRLQRQSDQLCDGDIGQYGFGRNGARRGYRQCAHDSRPQRNLTSRESKR